MCVCAFRSGNWLCVLICFVVVEAAVVLRALSGSSGESGSRSSMSPSKRSPARAGSSSATTGAEPAAGGAQPYGYAERVRGVQRPLAAIERHVLNRQLLRDDLRLPFIHVAYKVRSRTHWP